MQLCKRVTAAVFGVRNKEQRTKNKEQGAKTQMNLFIYDLVILFFQRSGLDKLLHTKAVGRTI